MCEKFHRHNTIKQCFNCWFYDHIKTQCHVVQKCSKCEKTNHDKDLYDTLKNRVKCTICENFHDARHKFCRVKKIEMKKMNLFFVDNFFLFFVRKLTKRFAESLITIFEISSLFNNVSREERCLVKIFEISNIISFQRALFLILYSFQETTLFNNFAFWKATFSKHSNKTFVFVNDFFVKKFQRLIKIQNQKIDILLKTVIQLAFQRKRKMKIININENQISTVFESQARRKENHSTRIVQIKKVKIHEKKFDFQLTRDQTLALKTKIKTINAIELKIALEKINNTLASNVLSTNNAFFQSFNDDESISSSSVINDTSLVDDFIIVNVAREINSLIVSHRLAQFSFNVCLVDWILTSSQIILIIIKVVRSQFNFLLIQRLRDRIENFFYR